MNNSESKFTKEELDTMRLITDEWWSGFPIYAESWEATEYTRVGDPYEFTRETLKRHMELYSNNRLHCVAILRGSVQYRFFALEEWKALRDKALENFPEDSERIFRGLLGEEVVDPEHPTNARVMARTKYAMNIPLKDK